MKKFIALLGSVLLFTGLKAQKEVTIKKETTNIVKETPASSKGIILPATAKPSKDITAKPSKDIIDKPVKVNPKVKPDKGG